MPKKIKLIILAIVFILGFCLTRDVLIKSLVGTVASGVTGAPTHIGSFSLSVIKQTVSITDFKMYSPSGFPRDILVDILKIDYYKNVR